MNYKTTDSEFYLFFLIPLAKFQEKVKDDFYICESSLTKKF